MIFKVGDKVKIHPDFSESTEEESLIFEVIEINGYAINIRAINSKLRIPPIERVFTNMIIKQ